MKELQEGYNGFKRVDRNRVKEASQFIIRISEDIALYGSLMCCYICIHVLHYRVTFTTNRHTNCNQKFRVL